MIICAIIIFVGAIIMSVSDTDGAKTVGAVIGLIGIIIMLLIAERESYKEGQIDCMNGKVKYRLEKQKDNSIEWVEIEYKK